MPSRRLEEITTWQKPFTFSASIRRRIDWRQERGVRDRRVWGRLPAAGTVAASPGNSTLARQGAECMVWGTGYGVRGAAVGCRSLQGTQVSVPHSRLAALGREG